MNKYTLALSIVALLAVIPLSIFLGLYVNGILAVLVYSGAGVIALLVLAYFGFRDFFDIDGRQEARRRTKRQLEKDLRNKFRREAGR